MTMKVQREQSSQETIQALQNQVDQLTAENMLLQDQLTRKEQFIAMIAHELRSPLSPIINYAQMLTRQIGGAQGNQQGQEDNKRSRAMLHNTTIIISQARRLSRLVNDLLDVSRISSGQFTLLREDCDIVALTRELVEQLRPVAPYHNLIVQAPEPGTPTIGHWDSGRLQQVLGNLLDNAIKYSDEHTTITTRIWTTAESVHISVHNEGVSIPSSDASSLFKPFVRLANGTHRQGSGLGLYITKSIIEAHGGVLRLEPPTQESTDDGLKGTTFTFDLPL
jgi:signal transduction histidine kinase